jgi:hypothetical protein
LIVSGDSAVELTKLDAGSCHSMVTDPPAGIAFMGKAWDADKGGRKQWIEWMTGVMAEAKRVLRPGSHALVWALPRTSHWTATALEDAGFEIRDVVTHLFGTGFPKSLNVGKKLAKWDGFGTALKPASEHWILARVPFKGTVAANVQEHGCGALNIDGCRVGAGTGRPAPEYKPNAKNAVYGKGVDGGAWENTNGRWPANLTLDEQAAAMLDEQSGVSKSSDRTRHNGAFKSVAKGFETPRDSFGFSDSGGASRFFYCAKASRKERSQGIHGACCDVDNRHPTVKSLKLCRWLCRLVTPPGGTVLDPFAGSGSIGVAAIDEGFAYVGIEQDEEHAAVALARTEAPLLSMTGTNNG